MATSEAMTITFTAAECAKVWRDGESVAKNPFTLAAGAVKGEAHSAAKYRAKLTLDHVRALFPFLIAREIAEMGRTPSPYDSECLLCEKEVRGGRSNVIAHLLRCHNQMFPKRFISDDEKKASGKVVDVTADSGMTHAARPPAVQNLVDAVAIMMAARTVSFANCGRTSKEVVHTLRKSTGRLKEVLFRGERWVSKATKKYHEKIVQRFVLDMVKAGGGSFTFDGWTSKDNRSFTGVMACFVNADFKVSVPPVPTFG
jgi:hypothetical protein